MPKDPMYEVKTDVKKVFDNIKKEVGSDNTSNPKDIIGRSKVPLSLAPPIAVAHMAHAFFDGAQKYGPYNWRNYPVEARVYVDACLRHIHAWFEGQDTDSESNVHHLGHALACLAIILDADANERLIDNRPISARMSYKDEINLIGNKIRAKLQNKVADYVESDTVIINPKNDQHFLRRK